MTSSTSDVGELSATLRDTRNWMQVSMLLHNKVVNAKFNESHIINPRIVSGTTAGNLWQAPANIEDMPLKRLVPAALDLTVCSMLMRYPERNFKGRWPDGCVEKYKDAVAHALFAYPDRFFSIRTKNRTIHRYIVDADGSVSAPFTNRLDFTDAIMNFKPDVFGPSVREQMMQPHTSFPSRWCQCKDRIAYTLATKRSDGNFEWKFYAVNMTPEGVFLKSVPSREKVKRMNSLITRAAPALGVRMVYEIMKRRVKCLNMFDCIQAAAACDGVSHGVSHNQFEAACGAAVLPKLTSHEIDALVSMKTQLDEDLKSLALFNTEKFKVGTCFHNCRVVSFDCHVKDTEKIVRCYLFPSNDWHSYFSGETAKSASESRAIVSMPMWHCIASRVKKKKVSTCTFYHSQIPDVPLPSFGCADNVKFKGVVLFCAPCETRNGVHVPIVAHGIGLDELPARTYLDVADEPVKLEHPSAPPLLPIKQEQKQRKRKRAVVKRVVIKEKLQNVSKSSRSKRRNRSRHNNDVGGVYAKEDDKENIVAYSDAELQKCLRELKCVRQHAGIHFDDEMYIPVFNDIGVEKAYHLSGIYNDFSVI